ncbi:uncharacterized protein LOC141915152 [Tubulanus polymorphus]|uniref:uncharacterized protein LOC141915152 n=1 Tax=Tubulanus polymorphus TaxID=672921 RepID=UPI003DA488ED
MKSDEMCVDQISSPPEFIQFFPELLVILQQVCLDAHCTNAPKWLKPIADFLIADKMNAECVQQQVELYNTQRSCPNQTLINPFCTKSWTTSVRTSTSIQDTTVTERNWVTTRSNEIKLWTGGGLNTWWSSPSVGPLHEERKLQISIIVGSVVAGAGFLVMLLAGILFYRTKLKNWWKKLYHDPYMDVTARSDTSSQTWRLSRSSTTTTQTWRSSTTSQTWRFSHSSSRSDDEDEDSKSVKSYQSGPLPTVSSIISNGQIPNGSLDRKFISKRPLEVRFSNAAFHRDTNFGTFDTGSIYFDCMEEPTTPTMITFSNPTYGSQDLGQV